MNQPLNVYPLRRGAVVGMVATAVAVVYVVEPPLAAVVAPCPSKVIALLVIAVQRA